MKNENVILDTIVEKEFNEMKLSPKEKINYLLLNYLDRLDVEPIFQKAVEQYANQIVIEELENIKLHLVENGCNDIFDYIGLLEIELKIE